VRKSLASVATSSIAGIVTSMGAAKKITIVVDEDLLRDAQEVSGLGVSEVVREGLRAVAASRASKALRGWRGKVRLELADTLREDR
jgi:Bacterial antitoxin of type II TA system, VapB